MTRALFLGLLTASLLQAAAPSAEELNAHLETAKSAWGISVGEPIELRAERLNDCNLQARLSLRKIAQMQWQDVQTTTTFDGIPAATTHKFTYIIVINSACDWSPQWLENVVRHEYGHILESRGGPVMEEHHSENKNSIMFGIVRRDLKQRILPEDLAALRLRRASSAP